MDERIMIIQHQGKEVICFDFSDLVGEEMVALIEQLPKATENRSELRILVDGTNSRGGLESMAAFRNEFAMLQLAQDIEGLPGTMRAAGIGVKGLGKILFDGLVRLSPIPIRAFESKAEALDWLVEE